MLQLSNRKYADTSVVVRISSTVFIRREAGRIQIRKRILIAKNNRPHPHHASLDRSNHARHEIPRKLLVKEGVVMEFTLHINSIFIFNNQFYIRPPKTRVIKLEAS